MPVIFRQGEGARTTNSRSIASALSGTSVSGVGLFVVSGGILDQPRPGDVLEAFSAISGNAGFYTLVGLSGASGYLVRPPPNDQSVSGGSLNRLSRASENYGTSYAPANITPLAGADSLALFHVSGAAFVTSGVRRNDRLVLLSGTLPVGGTGAASGFVAIVSGSSPHKLVLASGAWPTYGFAVGQQIAVAGINAPNSGGTVVTVNAISTTTNANDTLEVTSGLLANELTFTVTNTAQGICTATAHGFVDGDGPVRVLNVGGALPASTPFPGNLSTASGYYVNLLTANTFSLHWTASGAVANTDRISGFASAGTGTHIITRKNVLVSVVSGVPFADNGAWFVQEVLSEDTLVVRPPDNGANLVAVTGYSGGWSVRAGVHVLSGYDADTFTCAGMLASGVPLPGPAGSGPTFGSGRIRDWIRETSPRNTYLLENITQIYFNDSGLPSGITWALENEQVLGTGGNRGNTGEATVCRLNGSFLGTTPTSGLTIRLGTQPGNRYTADRGAVLVGVRETLLFSSSRVRLQIFGSYWDPLHSNSNSGPDARVTGSVLRGGFRPQAGAIVESPVVYGSFAYQGDGTPDSTANILMPSQEAASSVTAPNTTIEGMLFGDTVVGGISSTTGAGTVINKNPRQDDLLDVFWGNVGGAVEKHYTFNPRFVFGVSPLSPPVPISGLSVRIYEVNETTSAETQVLATTTNVSGYLSTGSGWDLRRELLTAGVSTLYSHRIVLEGAGFRLLSVRKVFRQPELADFNVDRIAPDYETEFDE